MFWGQRKQFPEAAIIFPHAFRTNQIHKAIQHKDYALMRRKLAALASLRSSLVFPQSLKVRLLL
jgi:hypothetical protein